MSRGRASLAKPQTTDLGRENNSNVRKSPRTKTRIEASSALADISKFEKNHHSLCEIENLTKKELIDLIQSEGFELPGKLIWDTSANINRKEKLKKNEYLAFVRQKLFSLDKPPVCQKVQKLGTHFCIVSIFPSLKGSVRVICYDTDRSMEYHLFLTAAKLEDLDVPKAPSINSNSVDYQEEENATEWARWSFPFINRLQLSMQGELFVGPARVLKTGLSQNFCLTGRDVKNQAEALKRKPSRVHVSRWFEKF